MKAIRVIKYGKPKPGYVGGGSLPSDFFDRHGLSRIGLVTLLDQANPPPDGAGDEETWLDVYDSHVNVEQLTVDNQPSIVGDVRVFDGINDFMVQEEIDDGSGLTFLPDAPFYNLLDGEARSQLPVGNLSGRFLQDFTTYSETDIPGKVTVGSNLITLTNGDRDEDYYVTKNMGAGAIGDFAGGSAHWVDVNVTSLTDDASCAIWFWALSNSDDDLRDIDDLGGDYVAVVGSRQDATNYGIVLQNVNGGTITNSTPSSNISVNTKVFLSISRLGTVFTAEVYSSSLLRAAGAAGDIDTVSMTSVGTVFNYVYGIGSVNSGQSGLDISGTIENLYVGIPANYINTDATHVVVITDSADAVICYGYPRVADVAESFGGESLPDPTLNSDAAWAEEVNVAHDDVAGTATWSGEGTFESVAAPFTVERLYEIVVVIDSITSGSLTMNRTTGAFRNSVSNPVWTTSGTKKIYLVCTNDDTYRLFGDAACDAVISNISAKPVLTLGTSAALIWNTPSGDGTQSWLRGDGDPNDPAAVRVNKSDLNFTGSMTAMMLVKPNDGHPEDPQAFLSKWNSIGVSFKALSFTLRTDGKLRLFTSVDGSSDVFAETTDPVYSDGAQSGFNLLVFTIDGSRALIYNNGVLVPGSTTVAASLFDTPQPLLIGAVQEPPAAHFAGEIAFVPIFNRDLSSAEVLAIYNGLVDDGRIP